MKEDTIERIYKRILHEIVEPITGTKITYNHDLNRIGKQLIGTEFLGVYPSDRMPKNKGYYIANVDKSSQPGTHWLGCVNSNGHRYIYDSFGRGSSSIIPHVSGSIIDADYDREQDINENNCGARCLAWLLVAQHLGIDNAMKI